MRGTRWVALAAAVASALGADGRCRGRADQYEGEAEGDRRRDHARREIHIAVIADVDNPIAPEPVQGLEGRGRGRRQVHQRHRRASAGRKLVVDFYDSQAQPERDPQRRDPGVPERRRDGRHLGGVR